MKIAELPWPVVASKADWLPGTTYLGFTPREDSIRARAQLQSTIQRQARDGLILEYVTKTFGDPNPGFEDNARIREERAEHALRAGRLVALHRLRPAYLPLEQIVGAEEYANLQDMWSLPGKPYRWSVAFPIVQSWSIDGLPEAAGVFGAEAYRRLYAHSSGMLRLLSDEHRDALAGLYLSPVDAPNAWIAIEEEIEIASRSEISPRLERLITLDLGHSAFEGETEERKVKLRKRAAWQAQRFVLARVRAGTLQCDHCLFNPASMMDAGSFNPRSVMDAHHKRPLGEGPRHTRIDDFTLLCPTCHRVEHALLKQGGSLF